MSSQTIKSIKTLDELKPGDHVKYECLLVQKKRKFFSAMHHALVVSVENDVQLTIIHNNGIEILEELVTVEASDILLVLYDCLYPGEEAIERARNKIGGKYKFLTDNCEHLVTWARSGNAQSKQVQKGAGAGVGGLAAGAMTGGVIGSVVPGVGTVAGAVAGGVLGLLGGLFLYTRKGKSKTA